MLLLLVLFERFLAEGFNGSNNKGASIGHPVFTPIPGDVGERGVLVGGGGR